MSKFKVGDNVKRVIGLDIFIERTGCDSGVITGVDSDGFISFNHTPTSIWDYGYFELVDDWSIYNNTLPLGELSDEHAAELFNYYRNGGKVEVMSGSGEWCDAISFVGFGAEMSYRAKQKSERELFIDAAIAACEAIKPIKGGHVPLLDAMFEFGFKAPKVGE